MAVNWAMIAMGAKAGQGLLGSGGRHANAAFKKRELRFQAQVEGLRAEGKKIEGMAQAIEQSIAFGRELNAIGESESAGGLLAGSREGSRKKLRSREEYAMRMIEANDKMSMAHSAMILANLNSQRTRVSKKAQLDLFGDVLGLTDDYAGYRQGEELKQKNVK